MIRLLIIDGNAALRPKQETVNRILELIRFLRSHRQEIYNPPRW